MKTVISRNFLLTLRRGFLNEAGLPCSSCRIAVFDIEFYVPDEELHTVRKILEDQMVLSRSPEAMLPSIQLEILKIDEGSVKIPFIGEARRIDLETTLVKNNMASFAAELTGLGIILLESIFENKFP